MYHLTRRILKNCLDSVWPAPVMNAITVLPHSYKSMQLAPSCCLMVFVLQSFQILSVYRYLIILPFPLYHSYSFILYNLKPIKPACCFDGSSWLQKEDVLLVLINITLQNNRSPVQQVVLFSLIYNPNTFQNLNWQYLG